MTTRFGSWAYRAGVSGTPTPPAYGRPVSVACHATTAGSLTIGGGDSIPVPAGSTFGIDLDPDNTGAPAIVFTGTDSYIVEYLVQPGTT